MFYLFKLKCYMWDMYQMVGSISYVLTTFKGERAHWAVSILGSIAIYDEERLRR